jgi:ADP-ribose pyrophosphatase
MAAGRLEHLGGFYLAPGYSTEYMNVYLARDLWHDPLEADADEILSVVPIPVPEAIEMAVQGKILDSKSLAAFLLAMPHLRQ